MENKNTIKRLILHGLLIAAALVAIFPILVALFASFKENMEILTSGSKLLPNKYQFKNYIDAWNLAKFNRYTLNSLFVTSFTIIGVLIVSTMAGYSFSRGNFKGKKIIFAVFISTMFLSWGPIMLYPQVRVANLFHIADSLWGLVILRVFSVDMAMIFLAKSYIDTIPKSLDEAAVIDGCGFFRIYWNILLPLMKPVIATVSLLTFGETWNDYLLPLVFTISKPENKTLTVGVVSLKSSGQVASSWSLMLAGSMMSIVTMLILYFSVNKYFISGLTTGSVKE